MMGGMWGGVDLVLEYGSIDPSIGRGECVAVSAGVDSGFLTECNVSMQGRVLVTYGGGCGVCGDSSDTS